VIWVKQPTRLLPRALARVLPLTVLALLGIWYSASEMVTQSVSRELQKALDREADQVGVAIGAKLDGLVDAARALAGNDLVINGLIDFEDRTNYLPVLFQSLRVPGPDGGRVTLTDYRGRGVVSNVGKLSYEGDPWIHQALAGKEVVRMTETGLTVMIPVRQAGGVEGAIVLEHGLDNLVKLLHTPSVSQIVKVAGSEGHTIYASDEAHVSEISRDNDHEISRGVIAQAVVPGFPDLKISVAEAEGVAFAAVERLKHYMLLALIFSILAIAGGIMATAYLTTSPLMRFLEGIQKTSAHNLDHRMEPADSHEFQLLTTSFNKMMENLYETTISRDYVDSILNSIHEMLLVTNADGTIQTANLAALKAIGSGLEGLAGQPIESVIAADVKLLDSMSGDTNAILEAEMRVMGGRTVPVQVSVSYLQERHGRKSRRVYVLADITERKNFERELEALALYDVLTGVANRSLFQSRLQDALANARRTGQMVAIMLLDLDHFKDINDSLGHPAGDALLKEVAIRLKHNLRETDTIARLGGDEFAVIATNIKNVESIPIVAEKLINALAAPFWFEHQEICTGTSIGITTYPADDNDSETMLKHADFALYQAKAEGRGTWRFYDAEMNAKRQARKTLEDHLARALKRNEFTLFYQPKIDARSGAVTGVEALIRWIHPDYGMMSPFEFVRIAEQSGQIVEIGAWVIRAACAQHLVWRKSGLPPIPVAVNLSSVQFKDGEVPLTLRAILGEFGLDPACIELEITESVIVENTDSVARQFCMLRKMGHAIAVDDFGTGYSSLAYLKHFPVDKLKIDRAFVANVTENSVDAALAGGVIALAKSLGMRTVAEGVETIEQLALLRRHGCDEIQGYYYSPPITAEEFAGWYRARTNKLNGAANSVA